MGCDYYGLPAPAPEPDVTSLPTLGEKTSSCQDSCCDIVDGEPLDTTASGRKSSPRRNRMIAALLANMRIAKPKIIPTRLTAAVAKLAYAATRFALIAWLCGNAG